MLKGISVGDKQLCLYDDLVVYILFYEQLDAWGKRLLEKVDERGTDQKSWKWYSTQFDYWMQLPGRQLPSISHKQHLFEIFYQVYRGILQYL